MIRNNYRYGVAAVTFPLGYQTNHYVEACSTLQTTKLAKEEGVKFLWLEGDSNNIIKFLRGEHPPSWSLKNMMEETKNTFLSFERVFFSHVYHQGNMVSDWMANEVVRRDTSHS